jgi:hypothetical protein
VHLIFDSRKRGKDEKTSKLLLEIRIAGISQRVKPINITIRYNKAEKDWTIDIDGKIRSHVSATEIEELLEYTMVAAEQSVEKPNGTPDTDPLNDQSKNNL